MKHFICIFFSLLISQLAISQGEVQPKPFVRKGFTFGLGIGAGTIKISKGFKTQTTFSATLPNIKIGYMLNQRVELLAYLPGATYKYAKKDRGFEGAILGLQFWEKENWWVMAGTGLTFDAAAFYTVKDPKKAGFYTGFPAITFATGLEIYHSKRFALDIQYRFFFGKSNLPNKFERVGISNMLLLGFNWY
jgi:hypothetical protein